MQIPIMFSVVKRLFRAAWDAEIDEIIFEMDLEREQCSEGHRWLVFLKTGVPIEEWPCPKCTVSWQANWNYLCKMVEYAFLMTLVTAPLWLPYALLTRRYGHDGPNHRD